VVCLANLNELDLALEVVDNLLIPIIAPPLNGEIHFSTGGDKPEGLSTVLIAKLGEPSLLFLRDMDITMKRGWLDVDL